MIPLFSALHTLAAQRGEGLRPELVRLLECNRSAAEASQRESNEAKEMNERAPQRTRTAA